MTTRIKNSMEERENKGKEIPQLYVTKSYSVTYQPADNYTFCLFCAILCYVILVYGLGVT